MRVLAIDYGLRRVGLAASDESGLLASPLGTVTWTTRDELFAGVLAAVERVGPGRILVGLPLPLDERQGEAQGQESESCRRTRNFAASLARRVTVPVELVDERFTSAEAEARLKDARRAGGRGPVKNGLDAASAAVLLESWLAGNRPSS